MRTKLDLAPIGVFGLLFCIVAALLYVVMTFGISFVTGSSSYWHSEVDDIAQYISGFNMYFNSPWQLPLLAFNSLNYPDGTRVTFVDSIPLYALVLKAILPSSLSLFNPFGFWVAFVFVLQAVSAWWLSRELRVNSWLFLASLLAVLLTFPALMARLGHVSLMSHWIILFAFAIYIRSHRLNAWQRYPWVVLLVSSFYVNVYLFVMASGIYSASFFASGFRISGRDVFVILRSILDFLLPFIVLLISALFLLLPLQTSDVAREGGFGYFSMNLLSPFLGGRFLQIQATEMAGQGEGFNYLGLGVILAFSVSMVVCNLRDRAFFERHWPLLLVMFGYALYSLSNKVYFGNFLVAIINYPEILGAITSQFRASGRFFWPVGYAVIIFSFLSIYRYLSFRVFVAFVFAVVLIQIGDIKDRYYLMKSIANRKEVQRINPKEWDVELGSGKKNIYFYPKFKCGKNSPHESLLPLMLYASKRGLNINTGYIARHTPSCDDVEAEIAASKPSESVYVFVSDEFDSEAAIKRMFPDDFKLQCNKVDFAFVCHTLLN